MSLNFGFDSTQANYQQLIEEFSQPSLASTHIPMRLLHSMIAGEVHVDE